MDTDEPDPDFLAAALRGAAKGKRANDACERALIECGYTPRPGDAAVITEAVYRALTATPERPDQ